jgi:hypothetical protein
MWTRGVRGLVVIWLMVIVTFIAGLWYMNRSIDELVIAWRVNNAQNGSTWPTEHNKEYRR